MNSNSAHSGQDPISKRQSIVDMLKKEFYSSGPLILVSFISLLISFVVPFSLASVIDHVILFNSPPTLYVIFVILLVTAVFEALLGQLTGRFAAFAAARATASIAISAISAALRQPTMRLLGSKGRVTISTLAEFNFFRDSLNQLVLYGVQLLFSIGVYMLVLLLLNPVMTLAVIATVPVHALIYWVLARSSKDKVKRSVKTNSEFIASVQTAVSAIETIHAYGLTRQQIGASSQLVVEALDQGFEARNATNTAQSISRFLQRITEAVIIMLGALAVMANRLTLGELVVFQMLLGRMTQPISQAGVSWDRLYRLRAISDEWQRLIDDEVEVPKVLPSRPVPGAPLLRVEKLEYQYPGASYRTLHAIDFELHGGEVLFLLGPSGSGKSTLVRLLTGILAPSDGSVSFRGLALTGIDERARRNRVAAAFQEPILLPGTIGENIASFDSDVSRDAVRRAAQVAGATEFIDAFANGFDTLVGTTGHAVSGGERQRICLARMLACEASVMIIDEGTSGLQRALEISVLEQVRASMSPEQALIVITHREDMMRLGTRAIRLEAGKIIEDRHIVSDTLTS